MPRLPEPALRSTIPGLLVLGGGLFLALAFAPSSERPLDPGELLLTGATEAQARDKHGGNLLFEVKKNRRKLPHVLFRHDSHLAAGHDCRDCHNDKIFSRERKMGVNRFSMKDINAGKACGACHDDKTVVDKKTVFGPEKKCERCHNVKTRVLAKKKPRSTRR